MKILFLVTTLILTFSTQSHSEVPTVLKKGVYHGEGFQCAVHIELLNENAIKYAYVDAGKEMFCSQKSSLILRRTLDSKIFTAKTDLIVLQIEILREDIFVARVKRKNETEFSKEYVYQFKTEEVETATLFQGPSTFYGWTWTVEDEERGLGLCTVSNGDVVYCSNLNQNHFSCAPGTPGDRLASSKAIEMCKKFAPGKECVVESIKSVPVVRVSTVLNGRLVLRTGCMVSAKARSK